VFLGTISLSFYLWHLPLVEKAKEWTVPDWVERERLAANPPAGNPLASASTFTGNYLLVVAITLALSLLVATLLYRFVELPFLRLKDAPLRTLWPRRPPGAGPGRSRRPRGQVAGASGRPEGTGATAPVSAAAEPVET
jgi:peptidoglycan/LPS O-acetylase OafA/YrhL